MPRRGGSPSPGPEMGGYCDCEVLMNAARRIPVAERIGQETFKTPTRRAIEEGWYCNCRVNGLPVSFRDAIAAKESGLAVEWHVPCEKSEPHAYPDVGRAS